MRSYVFCIIPAPVHTSDHEFIHYTSFKVVLCLSLSIFGMCVTIFLIKCLPLISFLYSLNNTADLRSCRDCVVLCIQQANGYYLCT